LRVADLDPALLHAGAALLGAASGLAATRVVDVMPRRLGLTHVARGAARARRNLAVLASSIAIWIGVAHVLARSPDVSLARGGLLLVTNGLVAVSVIAAAAVDVEHMVLPNALTLGPAVLCVLSSPARAVGLVGSVTGALGGVALAALPLLVYARVRGRSGLGLGDAKLALMAGAWHGLVGVPFVLGLAAAQATIAAVLMRALGVAYAVPASVASDIAALRARAASGDAEAKTDLDLDPMATDAGEGVLAMRLPLGPFLALASIEVLFLRRWLIEHVVAWLAR
jgi:leader peptidase (prepilin peptidase)/N-methyltransferase